jgi:L-alanine-DL-glutamate epimerase-like enolase superfamily enzyme
VQITDVTTIKLRFPMSVPMADAIHYMPERPTLLVEVQSVEGLVGLG